MLSCLFIASLWSPAGKGLTSWLLFMMCLIFAVFPTFVYYIGARLVLVFAGRTVYCVGFINYLTHVCIV